MPRGVTGNTSDSGSEESWFDPRRGNSSGRLHACRSSFPRRPRSLGVADAVDPRRGNSSGRLHACRSSFPRRPRSLGVADAVDPRRSIDSRLRGGPPARRLWADTVRRARRGANHVLEVPTGARHVADAHRGSTVHRAGSSATPAVEPDVFDGPVQDALAREFLADPRHHLVVALAEGRIVGMVSAVHYGHPDKPAELWINEVGVAPRHRGRGIARRMLDRMLEHGRELGCGDAWVATDHANTVANRLYRSAGGRAEDAVLYTFALGGGSDHQPGQGQGQERRS